MSAQAAAGGWATETVGFSSDGAFIPAFLAKPLNASAQAPAIIVLHEWWGLTDHIKDVSRRLSAEGYVTLAPDLYARQGSKVTSDPSEASTLMTSVSSQAVVRDLNRGIRWLKEQPFVDPLAIGVIGFSMGGTFALTIAAHNSDLKAAVAFYGKVPPVETFRYLLCPVLYHYPAKDGWITPQEVELLKQGSANYGKPIEVCVYPEATNAFFNDSRQAVYRAQDARAAWERTLAFLRRSL